MSTPRPALTAVAVLLVPGILLAASTSAAAAPPRPTIKSLTLTTGSAVGGTLTTLLGTGLATEPCESPAPCSTVTFTTGAGSAVPATTVRAYSTGVLQVVTPASAAAGKATITVTPVGGTAITKASAFTYTAAPPVVTGSNSTPIANGVLAGSPSSDTTTPSQTLTGTGLAGATLTVGGTSVKPTAPKAAPGYQPVVVKTAGGSVDVGLIRYTGAAPTITDIRESTDTTTVTSVSPGRVTPLVVRGTNLGLVRTAVLRDTTNAVPDQAFVVGTAATDGTTLRLTAPRGLRAVASGRLVLKSTYTETVASGAAALSTLAGSAPTLDSTLSLASGATALTVTGTNLGNLLAVTYNGRSIALGSVTAASATGFTVPVPATTATTTDGTATLAVTTDFGTVTRAVTVLAAPRLTQLAVDVSANTATLTSSKALAASGALSSDQVEQFLFTSTRDGEQVPITPTSITASGTSLVASFADGDLEAGDVVGATYTPGSDSSDHLLATPAAGGAALVALTPALRTTAPVVFASATRDAVTGVVTVTGQGLSAANEVTLTSSSSSVTRTGGALTVATTSSPRATTLAFAGPTVPGTYTVTVKSVPNGTAIAGPSSPVTVTVAAPTYTGVTRDPSTGVVTVAGTALSASNEFTMVSSGTTLTRSGGDVTVASDGLTSTFAGPADVGTWTVAMRVAARGAAVTSSGSSAVAVVAPVLSSPTADAGAHTITLSADAALTTVAAPGTGRAGQFTLSRDRCGAGATDVSSSITGLSVSGTSVVLTLSGGAVAAGDAFTAGYTPGASGIVLRGAPGTPVASASGLTTILPLPTRTFTAANRDSGTGDITLDGSNLATTNVVTVTGPGGYSATPSANGGGTSLALTFSGGAPTTAGTYTVELRESSSCGTVIDTRTFTI